MAKKHSLLGKAISAVLAFSLLVTATIGLSATKASAASAKIFSDEKATVVLFDDGSGSITLNDGYEFTKDNPLTEVAGVQLKDIITFNDGGFIDKYYTDYIGDQYTLDRDGINESPYNYIIYVTGRGPEGLFNGSGHLHFTDKTNDTYNLAIWSHSYYQHYVRYNSSNHAIKTISWNS